MEKRVRITKLIVVPVAFIDDGENLIEIEVEPLEVPANEIHDFVDKGLKQSLDTLVESFSQ